MIQVVCESCGKKYSVGEDKIGKKGKCSCGVIFEVKKDIKNPVKKINGYLNKKNFSFIIFGIMGVLIKILLFSQEFVEYKGYYYVIHGEALMTVYNQNKEILYDDVNMFYVGNTKNYIICKNEQRYMDGVKVPMKGEILYDRLESDCTIYNSQNQQLDTMKLDAGFSEWGKKLTVVDDYD